MSMTIMSLNTNCRSLGWLPIGISCIVFSSIMLLFPRILPRAAVRKREQGEEKKEQISTGKHCANATRCVPVPAVAR